MSDDASARLGLPYLAAGQLQKHVTLNEAMTRLDALVQTCVQSRSVTEPPESPSEGDLYILPEGVTDAAWEDFSAGDLVRFEAESWLAVPLFEGMSALILDEPCLVAWVEGAWALVAKAPEVLSELQQITRLGLNTSADANNPFAARLNKVLWTGLETGSGGDGDLRFTFNKQASSHVLSLLFQSNWGGRAELGLIGDDDLRLKVSADGGSWLDVFAVARSTGRMSFSQGATRRETTVVSESGSWSLPSWARWIEVQALGAGGGGGAGLGGSSGAVRYGGGGGGAGGMAHALWPAQVITSDLSLTIGAGGAGGTGNGSSGATGGHSRVTLGETILLEARGGLGGGAGQALSSSGLGGAGGLGHVATNGGGTTSITTAATEGQSSLCPIGPGGGGGGGGVNQTFGRSGGHGGAGGLLLAKVAGGVGGATAGGAGASATQALLNWAGGGGAGGGGINGAVGYAGGAGGLYGAGGGGGGAGLSTGGAGGAGAAGVILITAVG